MHECGIHNREFVISSCEKYPEQPSKEYCELQARSLLAEGRQARQIANLVHRAAIATSLALHHAHNAWQVRLHPASS